MLAKSFNDDLAWAVQRELVNKYFEYEPNPRPAELLSKGTDYHYFPKTYNGIKVITLLDFEHFAGFQTHISKYPVRAHFKEGKDYFLLKGAELANFKIENPSANNRVSRLIVLTRSGAEKLANYYSYYGEIPQMLEKREPSAVKSEITVEALPATQEAHTDETTPCTAVEPSDPDLINLRKAELLVKMSESDGLSRSAKAEALSSAYKLITGSNFSQDALNNMQL